MDSRNSPRPGLGGSHHLPPYSILYVSSWHPHPNGFLSQDSQGEVPKLSRFGLSGLCEFITFNSNLRLGWGLKKTCSSCWELSNDVSHSIYTHRGRVDSRLLVVRNQIVNLILGPSFCHNLCCRCPNGPCEVIFDIYTSIYFQWHEERLKVRCFDLYNRTLKFRESRRTPKSPFRECECHPHTFPKVGLRHYKWIPIVVSTLLSYCTRSHFMSNCTYPWGGSLLNHDQTFEWNSSQYYRGKIVSTHKPRFMLSISWCLCNTFVPTPIQSSNQGWIWNNNPWHSMHFKLWPWLGCSQLKCGKCLQFGVIRGHIP